MTKKEAIDFGKMWLELQKDSKDSNTYEFFVMAIKALEQERNIGDEAYAKGWENGEIAERSRHKQKPCEDAVSKEAVIALAKEECDTAIIPYKRFVKNVSALPPVTPKPKTGHWVRWYETIEQELCTIHDPHCKCSECNYEYDPYIASLFNFCPNCGAKMESEE